MTVVGATCLGKAVCGPMDLCAAPVAISHWSELCFFAMGVCFLLPF